jgi:hypothetical protein
VSETLHARCAVAAFKRAHLLCDEAHASIHGEPARSYGALVSVQSETAMSNSADDRSDSESHVVVTAHDRCNLGLAPSDDSHGRSKGEVAQSNGPVDRSNS